MKRDGVTYKSLSQQGLIPQLGPSDSIQVSGGLQSLYGQYKDTQALLRYQRALSGTQFRDSKAAIADQRKADLATAAAAANERGGLGGSADFLTRENVRQAASAARSSARSQYQQGLIQNAAQQQAAYRDFELGLLNLQAMRKAAQSQEGIEDFANNLLMSGDNSGGGLHPLLQKLVNKAGVDVSSGYRTKAQQRKLWQEALKKYGDPEIADNYVARPGESNHQEGIALDVKNIDKLLAFLASHPRWNRRIYRPMAHEPWHFELREKFV